MTFVKINDTLYPATISGNLRDREWDDRASLAVTLEMTYEEAVATFVDDMVWGHVYQAPAYTDPETGEIVTPEQEYHDDSDYSVAGPVTDLRNGFVTVKMGKLTDSEALQELMEVLNA